MSMGYLVPPTSPIVWRGLMVMKALQQLLHEVDWGGLDVLVLDMPPGTGDVQLTITQQIALDGAIIVSTPQFLALGDSVRGVEMFRKLPKPVNVLGLVQNMSLFRCPECGHGTHIFGGAEKVTEQSQKLGISMLADIPLHPSICEDADRGKPSVVADPDGEQSKIFLKLAEEVGKQINL
ncbi:hypothetical protein LTS18_010594 [Coniosporium uncinatum]|uniref:Uncharacterized protein n=1 Tax=Coniosporium uncinatum TaxID=93489 RepID=A0ACC3DKT3_9PEZI|nr:hypothetical protein LTS18_010594 [Coniosporium uncinatum]